jgi:hypothetical protein
LTRVCFVLSQALGWLLRHARYSEARIVDRDGERYVRKHRLFYAPLLVWLSGPLFRILDGGVRVLPQRDWQERERGVYQSLRGSSVRIDADGTLVLPCLAGDTLATLLDDATLSESRRNRAIELAVAALADLHRLGWTHGDAMAANVMVDLEPGAAHWFDFETIHESSRPMAWRRADDVRALLVTCLIRTASNRIAATLERILNVYDDEGVTRLLAVNFASVRLRSLPFHLAQAGLCYRSYQEIGRLLNARLDE